MFRVDIEDEIKQNDRIEILILIAALASLILLVALSVSIMLGNVDTAAAENPPQRDGIAVQESL